MRIEDDRLFLALMAIAAFVGGFAGATLAIWTAP